MRASAGIWSRLGAPFAALGLLLSACATAPPPPPALPGMSAAQCFRALDEHGVTYQVAALPASTGSCAVDAPVRVASAAVPWNQSAIMSCALAADTERFLREAAQPLAERYLGTRITRLDHFGAYSCRGSIGPAGHWSEHAAGRAIDVAGFLLADGGRITVEQDWNGTGPKRAFLRVLAERACTYFNVVLTPDTDRYHYNHLHLDIGPYRLCSL